MANQRNMQVVRARRNSTEEVGFQDEIADDAFCPRGNIIQALSVRKLFVPPGQDWVMAIPEMILERFVGDSVRPPRLALGVTKGLFTEVAIDMEGRLWIWLAIEESYGCRMRTLEI